MADIYRSAHPAVSPARAGRGGPRVLRRAAGLAGLATAAALVAACSSSGGGTAAGSGYGGASGSGGNSGSSGSGGSAAAASTTVMAHQLSGVGKVLVNGSGLTVYSVKTPSEKNGNIKCAGACTKFWIPVAGSASPGGSGLPGKLGTVHRPDGKTQLTYDGSPLYTFRLDTAPGQAHGNNYTDNFNGTSFTWQVVTASGKPAAGGGGATPAPSSSSAGSGGYGY